MQTHCARSISAASQLDLQVQQDVGHSSFGPLHQKDGVVYGQAGSLQAGAREQQRQGTARSLATEQEGQHLASNSAPQGAHGGMPASSEATVANLPESGSRAAAVVASPAASRPATEAGGQQQAPAKHGLEPTGEVATRTEAPCNGCADSGSSTAAVLPHLSHEWGPPAQQEQADMYAEQQAERAPVLHKEEPDALQTTQAQKLRAQQQHEPAVLLSRPEAGAHVQEGHDPSAWTLEQAPGWPLQQEHKPAALLSTQMEEANSQQVHVPPAWPSEVAQEVVAQQKQDLAALLPGQPQLPAAQQGQLHIALPPGQVELAGQSEELGALQSRQAQLPTAQQRQQQGLMALPSGQVEPASQSEEPDALLSWQVPLPAAQQGHPHIALPPGQVELAGQSEEPGALLSRQAQVARQREVQRRSRVTHMQSLQAQYVRQLHAAGEMQLQRWGAGRCSRAAHTGGMCMLQAMCLTGLRWLLWDMGMQADARCAEHGSTSTAAVG